jgi:hypothetical protein
MQRALLTPYTEFGQGEPTGPWVVFKLSKNSLSQLVAMLAPRPAASPRSVVFCFDVIAFGAFVVVVINLAVRFTR